MIGIRLVGGRFDGDRARADLLLLSQTPGCIYAIKCPRCPCNGCDWVTTPVEGADLYRRDEIDARGWLVYVYTDPDLEPFVSMMEALTEFSDGVRASS